MAPPPAAPPHLLAALPLADSKSKALGGDHRKTGLLCGSTYKLLSGISRDQAPSHTQIPLPISTGRCAHTAQGSTSPFKTDDDDEDNGDCNSGNDS